jgi:Icc-related predicted phosphoesterase
VLLSHYSPVKETLAGEPVEIYPFLGSYLLAEAADAAEVDLIFHGHAHKGTEKGCTPGGIRVRNVALPVIGAAYGIYCIT